MRHNREIYNHNSSDEPEIISIKPKGYDTENIKDEKPQSPHSNNQEIQTRPNHDRWHKFLNRQKRFC